METTCDHMEIINQSSAICDRNVSHNIYFFLILTDDSTLLSHEARMFAYSNAHLLLTWLALNIVARYECVYIRNSKNFKDKHKKSNSWEKSAGNLIEYFRIQNRCFLRFWSWRCRRFRTKRRNKFGCSKIASSMAAMLFALIFPRAERASTFDISAERNVWLQSALRSFAIVRDYMETALFAIVCDPRSSAIVCDHTESSLNS